MTTQTDRRDGAPTTTTDGPPRAAGPRWWRRPWIVPLTIYLVGFVVVTTPAYFSLQPALARVPLSPEHPMLHYWLVVAHVTCGTIAYLTVCLQLWPWLRRRRPRIHRISGRVYVWAGMLPASLIAVVLNPIAVLGDYARSGTFVWGILGFVTTTMGWWFARQRRWPQHRRWMLFSFALAAGVATGRLMAVLNSFVPGFSLSEPMGVVASQLHGFWLGWIVNGLLVVWWLRRSRHRTAATAMA